MLPLPGILSAFSLGAELSQHSSGKASKRAHAALHAMLPLHRAMSAASLAVSERAQKRWDLLRMHFLEFPLHSRALTRQKWHAVIEAALERKRELKHRHQVPPPPCLHCIRALYDDISAVQQGSLVSEVCPKHSCLSGRGLHWIFMYTMWAIDSVCQ